tara:strand:+ start:1703 stop:2023 length:321 start_codon:yes stop_codon:yes gene_type:complete
MAIKRNLSFPLSESKFDSNGPIKKAAKKTKGKNAKGKTAKNKPLRIEKARGNVIDIDTTGYSKGKKSFPYSWTRSNYGLVGTGGSKRKTGNVDRKTTDDLIKRYRK